MNNNYLCVFRIRLLFVEELYNYLEVTVLHLENFPSKAKKDQAVPNVLSIVFHPLWMPVLGTLVILFWSGMYTTMLPIDVKRIILLIVGLCTIGLPVFLYILYWMRHWYIAKRRERMLPLICTAIFYYIAYRALHSIHTPHLIQKFILASTIAVFLTSFISVFWKISLHGVGIGGITGMIASLTILSPILLPVLLGFIVLSGIVGYARIRLNAHNPLQYYAGLLLGFGMLFGMFLIT